MSHQKRAQVAIELGSTWSIHLKPIEMTCGTPTRHHTGSRIGKCCIFQGCMVQKAWEVYQNQGEEQEKEEDELLIIDSWWLMGDDWGWLMIIEEEDDNDDESEWQW